MGGIGGQSAALGLVMKPVGRAFVGSVSRALGSWGAVGQQEGARGRVRWLTLNTAGG